MNRSAEQHLTKAKDYVARGEEFYRKAAEEIVAAQTADPTLGTREIGEWFGRSHTWVQDIVRWHTTGKSTRGGSEGAPTPYAEQQGAVAKRHARSVLRDASPEEIAELLDEPEIIRKTRLAVSQAEPKWTAPHHEPSGPTFIDFVCRIREAQHGLDQLMKGWTGPEAIAPEFSPSTFIQIAETAMAQKDRVEQLREADHDEFQQIVRNFKVVSAR